MPAVSGTSVSRLTSRATCLVIPKAREVARTCAFQPASLSSDAERTIHFRRDRPINQRMTQRAGKLVELEQVLSTAPDLAKLFVPQPRAARWHVSRRELFARYEGA